MRSYPTIRQGLGKLTPELWQRLMKMLQSYESTYPRDERQPQVRQPGASRFLAKITGNSLISDNRYKYAWSEVEVDATDFSTKTGGRSGTVAVDYALNTIESGNDSEVVGPSVDISGDSDYPAGFSMQAVGEQGEEPVVIMHKISDVDGNSAYFFSCSNAHDGECP